MKRESDFLYLKLANIIRDQIVTGFIKPGQFLLSENELRRHYDMSRFSVRKALDLLLEEGLIVKKAGQGTIVSPDFVVPKDQRKTLKIMVNTPSYYIDYCMPIILDNFSRKYPQVEVKILPIASSTLGDSFEAGQELGFTPDLLLVGDKQQQELMMDQPAAFMDLRDLLHGCLAPIYPRLVRAFTESGTVVAIPASFSSIFLVCNPRMFQACGVELPHNVWDETDFLTIAKRLTNDTDNDGIANSCGFSLPISLNRWPAIAIANGVRFQFERDEENIARSLTFIHDLLFRYRVATLVVRNPYNSEAFLREKSGMVLTTTYELASWRHNGLSFEPQVAPMPFGSPNSPLLIASAYMIPRACSDIELACRFLEVALSPEVQMEIARKARFLSVLPDVNMTCWDSTQLKSMGLTLEGIENSCFLHELIPNPTVMAELDHEMELFWAGLESAGSFSKRFFNIVTQKQSYS